MPVEVAGDMYASIRSAGCIAAWPAAAGATSWLPGRPCLKMAGFSPQLQGRKDPVPLYLVRLGVKPFARAGQQAHRPAW